MQLIVADVLHGIYVVPGFFELPVGKLLAPLSFIDNSAPSRANASHVVFETVTLVLRVETIDVGQSIEKNHFQLTEVMWVGHVASLHDI